MGWWLTEDLGSGVVNADGGSTSQDAPRKKGKKKRRKKNRSPLAEHEDITYTPIKAFDEDSDTDIPHRKKHRERRTPGKIVRSWHTKKKLYCS